MEGKPCLCFFFPSLLLACSPAFALKVLDEAKQSDVSHFLWAEMVPTGWLESVGGSRSVVEKGLGRGHLLTGWWPGSGEGRWHCDATFCHIQEACVGALKCWSIWPESLPRPMSSAQCRTAERGAECREEG